MSCISQKIEQAWEHRIGRELDKCLTLCSELKQAVRLPVGELKSESVKAILDTTPQESLEDFINVTFLSSSLDRAMQRSVLSNNFIEEVEKILWERGNIEFFTLYFEKGMSAFWAGDYSRALENLLISIRLAKAPWEKICSRANTLFCLENLGISTKDTLSELENTLKNEVGSPAKCLVQNQLQAFYMRQSFRSGKVKEALSFSQSVSDTGQAEYYRLWVKSLPYHVLYESLSTEEVSKIYHSRFFQYGEYRLRSLKGSLHPNDGQAIRPTELSDRFYLWVWKWLLAPEKFPVQKITLQLKNLNFLQLSHQMTVEDSLLFRNSLLWLGLFDPIHDKVLTQKIAALDAPAHSHFLLFEIEALLIHYCRAVRDQDNVLAKDLYSEITLHPLCKSRELYFCLLVRSLSSNSVKLPTHLKGLAKHLRSTLLKRESTLKMITVDLTRFQVQIPEQSKPIYSRPMVLALDLLRTERSVSIERFSDVCLGISRFDSLIHMPRIYNLLARLKAIKTLKLGFRVRDGFVVSEGDWKAVAFTHDGTLSKVLSQDSLWNQFLTMSEDNNKNGGEDQKKSSNLLDVKWKGAIGRKEIQGLFGRPRSTTNRILKKLILEKRVQREGKNDRVARYRLVNSNLNEVLP